MTDNFVDRVMPAYIFCDVNNLTIDGHCRRSMRTSGKCEYLLLRAKVRCNRRDHIAVGLPSCID
tara:strand:- start:431 stop:622 length:192 start_codon:yes stop_codon:yes gene_type:complete